MGILILITGFIIMSQTETASSTSTRRRFPRLKSNAFEHPEDAKALEAVRQVPYIDKIFKKFMELGLERIVRIQLFGQAIHVSPKQCPKIYALFKEACDILDMHEPDLFLANNPYVNAFTFGVDRPFIVLHSSLVDLLEEDELMAVIGHELGHVKSGHVLYRSIVFVLVHLATRFFGLGGAYGLGAMAALLDWSRKSELTADRAELLVVQDIDACIRLHMKLAGGSKSVYNQINAQEFLRQADSYEEIDYSMLNKVYKLLYELKLSHPVPVYRAKELKTWSTSKQYTDLINGKYSTQETIIPNRSCPHCGTIISPEFFFCPDCGKNVRV